MLDATGPISVDMMGGQAADGRNFDPDVDTPPEFPMDFDEFRSSDGWQGYALYDIADDQYVRWGFPTFTNDGKEKDGRDVWERVTIPAEELAELANDGKEYRLDIFDAYLGGWGWIGIDTVQIPDLSFTASSPIFDCNGDNITDLSDLACVASIADRDTVLGELGSLPGDFDGDGSVGFPDFLILSANFGQTAAASTSAVPEPSTGALGLLGLLALMCVRRSRR